jgi:hypothetical protein
VATVRPRSEDDPRTLSAKVVKHPDPDTRVTIVVTDRPRLLDGLRRNHPIIERTARFEARLAACGLAVHGGDRPATGEDHALYALITLEKGVGKMAYYGLVSNWWSTELATPDDVDALLDRAFTVLEECPLPATEWQAVRDVLDDELLMELVGASAPSVRRYAAGERATPDDVAARLHFIALVNGDVAGSYNDLGIRRWWRRPRARLDGRSPVEALGPGFDPDGPTAQTVRSLAAALVGPGAAT